VLRACFIPARSCSRLHWESATAGMCCKQLLAAIGLHTPTPHINCACDLCACCCLQQAGRTLSSSASATKSLNLLRTATSGADQPGSWLRVVTRYSMCEAVVANSTAVTPRACRVHVMKHAQRQVVQGNVCHACSRGWHESSGAHLDLGQARSWCSC
jgi:hypothetical protein